MTNNWTPDDRDQLREYLTRHGEKFFEELRSYVPKMDAMTIEGSALQAKEFKGANDIIKKISEISEPVPNPGATSQFEDVSIGL